MDILVKMEALTGSSDASPGDVETPMEFFCSYAGLRKEIRLQGMEGEKVCQEERASWRITTKRSV